MVMSVCNDVLREGVRSVVGEVGEEVVREAETKRQEKLEKLEKQVLKNRLQRHWKRYIYRKIITERILKRKFILQLASQLQGLSVQTPVCGVHPSAPTPAPPVPPADRSAVARGTPHHGGGDGERREADRLQVLGN